VGTFLRHSVFLEIKMVFIVSLVMWVWQSW